MRLKSLLESRSPEHEAFTARLRERLGFVPGPFLTMSHAQDLFGKNWGVAQQEAMRRTRFWTLGDVELFAAYISKLNTCRY